MENDHSVSHFTDEDSNVEVLLQNTINTLNSLGRMKGLQLSTPINKSISPKAHPRAIKTSTIAKYRSQWHIQ